MTKPNESRIVHVAPQRVSLIYATLILDPSALSTRNQRERETALNICIYIYMYIRSIQRVQNVSAQLHRLQAGEALAGSLSQQQTSSATIITKKEEKTTKTKLWKKQKQQYEKGIHKRIVSNVFELFSFLIVLKNFLLLGIFC